jgi:hypothetical protein
LHTQFFLLDNVINRKKMVESLIFGKVIFEYAIM